MLLRLILLSFFQDLSGGFLGCFRDVLDVDLFSLFIVGELTDRV
jgi:hypothetical protein